MNYIEFLGQLGIISECAVTKTGDSAIVLDRFPRLQSDRTFYVNPVDLIPNKRPVHACCYVNNYIEVDIPNLKIYFINHLYVSYTQLLH